MAHARRSVKDVDLQAYKDFHANQQKAKQQAGDLPGEKFFWPDSTENILQDEQPNTNDDIYGLYQNQDQPTQQNADDDIYGL